MIGSCISYLYIVTIINDIGVGLFHGVQHVFELSLAPLHLLLHGVEPLLVLGLHLLRLFSGPDLPLQLLPLLLLGKLLLVLGLNQLNPDGVRFPPPPHVELVVANRLGVNQGAWRLPPGPSWQKDYIMHQRIDILWNPKTNPIHIKDR